ncbi:dynein light chain Tctex-type 5-B-like [Oculina patagonica]
MDQPFLNPDALAPRAPSEEGSMSIKTIANAKLWARRRRRSLFDPRGNEDDYGNSFLSHADFPQARAKSTFTTKTAHKIMEQVLNMELSFKSYDVKECANASNNISKVLKEKLCSTFDLSGCKLVCLCYITKRSKPSLAIDSGSAWDDRRSTVDKDAFVDCVYKNQDIVAVASVFLIYFQRLDNKKSAMDSLQAPSTTLPKVRSSTFS